MIQAFKASQYLRTLEVTLAHVQHLQAPNNSNQLEDGYEGSPTSMLPEDVCEQHVIELYKELLGDSVYPCIEPVKVNMRISNTSTERSFEVKSQSRDGQKSTVQRMLSQACMKLSRVESLSETSFSPLE